MNLMRSLLIAACGIAFVLHAPVSVAACECMRAPEARDALADSSAVFLGTVTHVSDPERSLRFQSRFPFVVYDIPPYAALTVTLAVSQTWRGPAYRTMTLTTGRYPSSCGVPFQAGREYLVYAYYNGVGDLMTHRCSRTTILERAGADLAQFGPGNPALAVTPTPAQPVLLAVSCIAVLIVAAASGVLLLRRTH